MNTTARNCKPTFVSPGQNPGDGRDLLIFIPHAGSTGESYMPWFRHFAPVLDCRFLQLPGRGRRMDDPSPEHLEDLVQAIQPELCALQPKAISLFGHSMGALIAYELARHMSAWTGREAKALFVSGCRPPSQPLRCSLGALSDEALLDQVVSRSVSEPQAADKAWFIPFLPLLRRDLALCESHPFRMEGRLGCPLGVFWGTEDTLLDQQAQAFWLEQSTAGVSLHPFPGDHFFLQSHKKEIARIIHNTLNCA